ncbi:unnamed protein product [Candidula unifasciata]|uniref:N-terminal methionine N(alpha)-acetyltransferase NatC n=1 Tax=Candidula unifasciata TaxID=100452 RepID=A0A8S3ZBE8_9EUPU|nr:unnamed protein product [Candidula unifasciata]
MADHTTTVACLPQTNESSLISPSTHRHGLLGELSHSHCHLNGNNNLSAQHSHSNCSHSHIINEIGLSKDNVMCKKPLTVEGSKEQCNGHLQVDDADFDLKKRMGHKQNGDATINNSDEQQASPTPGSNSQYAAKANYLEKLNGLTNSVAGHSSQENECVFSLLNSNTANTHSKVEDAAEIENHNCSSVGAHAKSVHESQYVCKCRHLKSADIASRESDLVECADCSPVGSSTGEIFDTLVSELKKACLGPGSSSNELSTATNSTSEVTYVVYESERQMPDIMRLITKDLSEPYSIYTYRYFIHNWPNLCFLAVADGKCVGAIVCKLDLHKKMVRRGYIAMLAVDSEYRRRQIGSTLVTKAIEAMIRDNCDEVVLETEITNQGALRLYENLGFVRDKRLFRYYLNGVDALRLKLWLR